MRHGPVKLPADDGNSGGTPRFQPESLLGRLIGGRYRISGHLASGGMAAVYIAEDTVDGREVALKVLLPELAGSPEAVRRFLCEAAIASLIDHPNVVRVLGHGCEEPCFIAMELLQGEGLYDRLRRRGSLPPAEAVAILAQVCAGLDAAHRQGVVHRDLKPENVFLHAPRGSPPVAKIIDFGVAGGSHGADGDTGRVIGTPEYLSPEQARGQPADPRADLYSVGIMAWRMLVGRAPFVADTPEALIRMQALQPVPSLITARPELASHPELARAVERACAKNPSERPATAADLGAELQQGLARDAARNAPPPRQPPPRPAPAHDAPAAPPGAEGATRPDRVRNAKSRRRAFRLWVALAVALVVGLAGATVWLASGGGSSRAHAPVAPPGPGAR